MNEPIQDKSPKPAGLLPKNVQSWLILGLAVLMVLIMWLTGGNRSTTLSKGTASFGQSAVPVEVNEAKITDLQSRIQQLQREQTVAQSALAQTRSVANPAVNSATSGSTASAGTGERAEDVIQAERKKREYLSLFASNVAMTYRKNPVGAGPRSQPPRDRNRGPHGGSALVRESANHRASQTDAAGSFAYAPLFRSNHAAHHILWNPGSQS